MGTATVGFAHLLLPDEISGAALRAVDQIKDFALEAGRCRGNDNDIPFFAPCNTHSYNHFFMVPVRT
jgi:hypothetical protein